MLLTNLSRWRRGWRAAMEAEEQAKSDWTLTCTSSMEGVQVTAGRTRCGREDLHRTCQGFPAASGVQVTTGRTRCGREGLHRTCEGYEGLHRTCEEARRSALPFITVNAHDITRHLSSDEEVHMGRVVWLCR